MSSAQIPARFGAAGRTLPGAAEGSVPCRSLLDVSSPVLTRNNDAAQGWTVYEAASHELPHTSPVVVLGGQRGEMRPRELMGSALGHTAEGHQGGSAAPGCQTLKP